LTAAQVLPKMATVDGEIYDDTQIDDEQIDDERIDDERIVFLSCCSLCIILSLFSCQVCI
jgi:hypothetical protein